MGVNSCGTTMLDQGAFVGLASIDWDTTAKTSNFTAVSDNGYFVNTTSTAITVTLPAGSIGDILGFSDYASTFASNSLTLTPNGTDKINGTNDNSIISVKGICFTLIYVDSTQGWKSIESNSVDPTGESFITATGGTVTTCGDYKIHAFTGPGTFTVTCLGQPTNTVEYLVVAGGASGGGDRGGGGGAGGLRHNFPSPVTGGQPVSATGYPITIGSGGSGVRETVGNNGSSSSAFGFTSAGGGGGAHIDSSAGPGGNGGGGTNSRPGGTGNVPPVSPSQGTPGGTNSAPLPANQSGGGGGGGFAASGGNGGPSSGGNGGNGGQVPQVPTSYGSPAQYFAGGGGGGRDGRSGGSGGSGGLGGGTAGVSAGLGHSTKSGNGAANTGGGSGGSGVDPGPTGGTGNGGSGIVIIRYKFQ